jgi:hypothetical protein
MPTQHIRRIRTMALETFNILNGLAPPVLSNLVQKQDHKSKFNMKSISTPKSLTTSSHDIFAVPI